MIERKFKANYNKFTREKSMNVNTPIDYESEQKAESRIPPCFF